MRTPRLGQWAAISSAETDAQMHAEILTYSRSRGIFRRSVTAKAPRFGPMKTGTKSCTAKPISNRDIVLGDTPFRIQHPADLMCLTIFPAGRADFRRQAARRQAAVGQVGSKLDSSRLLELLLGGTSWVGIAPAGIAGADLLDMPSKCKRDSDFQDPFDGQTPLPGVFQ